MKVLLLTQVLPYPPDSGPKVKTWNTIKCLAREHELTLVSFARGESAAQVGALRQYCRVHTSPMRRTTAGDAGYLLSSLLRDQPFLMRRDQRLAMRRLVDRVAAQDRFDVVHADQLNMVPYAQRVSAAVKVLDAHNALWLLYKRLAETSRGLRRTLLAREWRLLQSYERAVCREFDLVLAVNEEDLEALGAGTNARLVPIAVDTAEVAPVEPSPDADRIVHVGTMYWPPNVDGVLWFIDRVLPRIRRRRPAAVLEVIGARPPRLLRRAARRAGGVEVTGYVADLGEHLGRAGVFIVPLLAGGGMRVKILEALAQELPVVSTSMGCNGIAAQAGRDLLVADDPQSFAEATLRLLEDRPLAATLGRNGRELVRRLYDRSVVCPRLLDIYRGLTPAAGTSR